MASDSEIPFSLAYLSSSSWVLGFLFFLLTNKEEADTEAEGASSFALTLCIAFASRLHQRVFAALRRKSLTPLSLDNLRLRIVMHPLCIRTKAICIVVISAKPVDISLHVHPQMRANCSSVPSIRSVPRRSIVLRASNQMPRVT